MATLTILKDEKVVDRDGYAVVLDAVDLPSNVHAVYWDGSSGWIEYNDSTANEFISSISEYSTITDDYSTKKTTEQNSYAWKRQNDATTSYARIGDQLDQLYVDMLAGKLDATGEWAKGIKAVKDAHPK